MFIFYMYINCNVAIVSWARPPWLAMPVHDVFKQLNRYTNDIITYNIGTLMKVRNHVTFYV